MPTLFPRHPSYAGHRADRLILIGDIVKHEADDGAELAAVTGVLDGDAVRIRYVVGDGEALGEFEPYVSGGDLTFIERSGETT